MIKRFSNLPFGTKLWIGLTSYVLVGDSYAVVKGKETFSRALYRALDHPAKRWMVSLSWLLTTKHLFFRNFCRWLDPFLWIGYSLEMLISYKTKRKDTYA